VPVFYDERDDLIDRQGLFAGHGLPITECPECDATLATANVV